MRDHARFERLAGAVALGEATPSERDAFAAHAAVCAACRADADDATATFAALGASRDSESWCARLDNVVACRIRDARADRANLTFGALGWAVALSLVLNVAVLSGFTTHLAAAFRDAGEPRGTVIATRLFLGEKARPRRTTGRARVTLPDLLAGFDVERRDDGARTLAFRVPPVCDRALRLVPDAPCAPGPFAFRP